MDLSYLNENYNLVLASASPRRRELLQQMGLPHEVRVKKVRENYPTHLQGGEISAFLAEKKAEAQRDSLTPSEILLTSDTVVWCDGESLEKAKDVAAACAMLHKISGRSHQVFTSICLCSTGKIITATDEVKVWFRTLTDREIEYYIHHYKPFDKAGAYGIQEWIGMVGIEKIEGSYFTVMGLPTHLLVEKLQEFV